MNLPARPACFGQVGLIHCECSTWDTKDRNDCISARYLWMAAKVCADLPTNRKRQDFVDVVGSVKGPKAAEQLKAAAKKLMEEAA